MDALVKSLEARGFRVEISEDRKPETHVVVLGQRVQIALEEKIRADRACAAKERSLLLAEMGLRTQVSTTSGHVVDKSEVEVR